jgi:hypothetical protein
MKMILNKTSTKNQTVLKKNKKINNPLSKIMVVVQEEEGKQIKKKIFLKDISIKKED